MRTVAAPLRTIALAAILMCVAPSLHAEPAANPGGPSAALVDSMSRQHHRNDWLVIATDSTWLDASVREIGLAGLAGIRLRHSNRRIEHLAWSSIRRLDRRSSLFRQGQVVGLLVGGTAGVRLAQEIDAPHQARGAVLGGLFGLWLLGKVGALWVTDHPLYRYAAAVDSTSRHAVPSPPRAWNPNATAIWLAALTSGSRRAGEFRPTGPEYPVGRGAQISITPAHFPIGARFGGEGASYRSSQSATAPVFGAGSAVPVNVTTHTSLLWLTGGPLWDPRPHASSVFAFATIGLVRVASKGQATWGSGPLGAALTYDMPGLPPTTYVFASSAGVGGRVVLGASKNVAVTTELDYRHSVPTDYIGAPGAEGGDPDLHFSARHGAIEMVSLRLGIAASWDRRAGAPR